MARKTRGGPIRRIPEGTSSRLLDPRLDLCDHSPNFEWGGGGPGADQLALAILADYLEDAGLALELHQRFRRVVVAKLPHESWMLSDDDIAAAVLHLPPPEGDASE